MQQQPHLNMRCRDEDVIPTSLRIKPKVRTREGYAIAERASKAFLWTRVYQTFCRKQSLVKQIVKLEALLEKDLLTEDYSKVTKLSHNSAKKTFVKSKQNHQSKLEAVLKHKHKQKQPELRPEGRDRWVVNLHDRESSLTHPARSLSMGLNYAPVPTKFPPQDTIASVEEVAKQLPKHDADDLQGHVCGILRSARLPKENLRKDHRKALKELRTLEDEVILPADKWYATMVMRRRREDEGYAGRH